MKKLINLIALTIALAVVFVGCGNPAIPQDQDDGETVTQFLEKLITFGAGVTEDGTMKVTFVKKGTFVYENKYEKENGIWKTLNEGGDDITNRIKKISNGIYGISGDGKIQILIEMKENSLIYRDPENPNTNYYEFIRSESEIDDGENVTQFIQRLIDFKEGITADNSVKFTFDTYENVFAFKFYIKKDGEFVTELQDEYAFKLSKLVKVNNNLFVYDKNTMWFSLSENKLTVKLADVEEITSYFGYPENNTLVLIKSNN